MTHLSRILTAHTILAFSVGLSSIFSASPLSAGQVPSCKPCLGDPIETSARRASGILMGKVFQISEFPAAGGKSAGGEASLWVRTEKWLLRPSSGAGKKGVKVPLRVRWEGACIPRPALPTAGDRAIFFIEKTEQNEELLTGACTTPILKLVDDRVVLPTEAQDVWGRSPLPLSAFEKRLKTSHKK